MRDPVPTGRRSITVPKIKMIDLTGGKEKKISPLTSCLTKKKLIIHQKRELMSDSVAVSTSNKINKNLMKSEIHSKTNSVLI